MAGTFSPNMINASSGMLPGVAGPGNYSLGVNTQLITAIENYQGLGVISAFRSMYGTVGTALGSVPTGLKNLMASSYPAITDAAVYTDPSSGFSGTQVTSSGDNRVPFSPDRRFMTDLVLSNAEVLLGYDSTAGAIPNTNSTRDLSKFCQIFGMGKGYLGQANEIVNSTKNSDIPAIAFTSMENLSSGGVSQVTPAFGPFGKDLTALGQLMNLATLDRQGYPSNLIRQLLSTGGLLPPVYAALQFYEVPVAVIASLRSAASEIAPADELKMYQALASVTGDDLAQILKLLDITTPNITTAADLLNPQLIFPLSYRTFVIQIPIGGPVPINERVYIDGTSVSSKVQAFFATNDNYITLSKIIPPEQALANCAWVYSMNQIKNIKSSKFEKFAASVAVLENNAGLSNVNNLTAPIPLGVQSSINAAFATGTGPDNTVTIYDFVGTAAGYVHTDAFTQITAILAPMDFSALIAFYGVISGTALGNYTVEDYTPAPPPVNPGDPPGADVLTGYTTSPPGVGSFSTLIADYPTAADARAASINMAINAESPIATSLAEAAAAANQAGLDKTNILWSNMDAQLNRETQNHVLADLIFDYTLGVFKDISGNSRSAVMSFVGGLHGLGKDVTAGGPAEFLEKVAVSNLPGNSVIAAMREGRNLKALSDAGISTDTQLNSENANPVPANLIPANT